MSSDAGSLHKDLLGYTPLKHPLLVHDFNRTAFATISSNASGDTGRKPVASRLTFTFLRRIATSECVCPCTAHSNPCTSRPPGQLVRLMRINHREPPHSSRNIRQQHKPPINPHIGCIRSWLPCTRIIVNDFPRLSSPKRHNAIRKYPPNTPVVAPSGISRRLFTITSSCCSVGTNPRNSDTRRWPKWRSETVKKPAPTSPAPSSTQPQRVQSSDCKQGNRILLTACHLFSFAPQAIQSQP